MKRSKNIASDFSFSERIVSRNCEFKFQVASLC